MTTADGALTLVFNGEIYNYIELRTELAALGHRFRSMGDTEVLLAAYRQWGPDCVGHFNGMWAFALWDSAQQRLFCSRDRFGVKPFYYVQRSALFAFASEPKALWQSGLVEARPDMTLLGDFLAGYESSKPDASMFDGIYQLPGGYSLIVSAQGIERVQYWSLPCNPDLGPPQPDAGPIARVRQMLIESVRLRLRSDVPVGTCLSGGLDSSAIACLANDLMQHERNIPRSLVGAHQKTFTACYDDTTYDERPYAQMVVDQTGAEWHQAFPTAESLLADLDRFLWHHDEPPITTSIYAQWCVMRLVREKGIVVTLDGQGADELLGGYLPHDVYLSQILLAGQAGRLVREARAAGAVGGRPMRDILARVAASRLPAAARRHLQAGRPGRMLGLSREIAAAASARHQEMFGEESLSNLPRHLNTLTTANLPRLLRSEDRNSMAFSVEARTPFLDVHLAEYISLLPAVYRIHNGWSKVVLRRAVEGIVPDAICWRRDKKGFVTPEGAWLRVLRPVLADVFNGTTTCGAAARPARCPGHVAQRGVCRQRFGQRLGLALDGGGALAEDDWAVRIYLYHKVDRGYYESAHVTWRSSGGSFADHLLRAQPTLYSWRRELERLGCDVYFDLRSSYLLPQTRRCYLPMSLSGLLRGSLWVTRADPWLLQRDIIRRIEAFRPDIAFFPLGSSVWESTLTDLRRRGVRLVQWCGLPAGTMMERDRVNLPFFDLIFQPANLEKGLRAAGAGGRIEYIPIGVDPEVYRPLQLTAEEQERYGAEVCFIGGLSSRYHQARRELIEYAIKQGVQIKVWGGYREHFLESPILRCWQGQIWGKEQVKALCAAQIGLNFHVDHRPGELDRGLNIRAFELAACSVFQLMQRVPGVGEFFEAGRDIVCFDTREEMLERIRYYLTHDGERQAIAAAGRARVVRDHTWASRVERMVRCMAEL